VRVLVQGANVVFSTSRRRVTVVVIVTLLAGSAAVVGLLTESGEGRKLIELVTPWTEDDAKAAAEGWLSENGPEIVALLHRFSRYGDAKLITVKELEKGRFRLGYVVHYFGKPIGDYRARLDLIVARPGEVEEYTWYDDNNWFAPGFGNGHGSYLVQEAEKGVIHGVLSRAGSRGRSD